jgi:uncharacterized protein related to proFAR isomerase
VDVVEAVEPVEDLVVDVGAVDVGPQHAGAVDAGAVDAGADVVDDDVAVKMQRQGVSLNGNKVNCVACCMCISSMSRASNNIGCQGGSREKMWS